MKDKESSATKNKMLPEKDPPSKSPCFLDILMNKQQISHKMLTEKTERIVA